MRKVLFLNFSVSYHFCSASTCHPKTFVFFVAQISKKQIFDYEIGICVLKEAFIEKEKLFILNIAIKSGNDF